MQGHCGTRKRWLQMSLERLNRWSMWGYQSLKQIMTVECMYNTKTHSDFRLFRDLPSRLWPKLITPSFFFTLCFIFHFHLSKETFNLLWLCEDGRFHGHTAMRPGGSVYKTGAWHFWKMLERRVVQNGFWLYFYKTFILTLRVFVRM